MDPQQQSLPRLERERELQLGLGLEAGEDERGADGAAQSLCDPLP